MRHVTPARLRKDENGNVLGFIGPAFRLREGEEYLSAAWIEHAATHSREADIAATVEAFKASGLTVRPSHRFAVGNVGRIREACATHRQKVRISHEPEHLFDAHASVRQFNSDNDELLELLAEEAWAEMCYPS